MTTLFANTVTLRGFLGKDAEVPDSSIVTWHSYAVLTLCTGSGTWNKAANEFIPRTDMHWIICSGPYFCGLTRGMKQGDYIEVEGELRGTNAGSSIQALQIRRLEYPPVGVEESNDD
jgi:hypothetical protein